MIITGSASGIGQADEMVTEIQVPEPSDGAKQTFSKFRLRESVDFPIISIASVITINGGVCQDARIALGAVAPAPIRLTMVEQAIKGKPINTATVESASEAAITGAIPLAMNAYKVEITKTLVKRVLLA